MFLINSFQCSEFSTNINIFLSSWEYKPAKENDQQFQLRLFILGISNKTFGQDKQSMVIPESVIAFYIKASKDWNSVHICVFVCVYM